MNLVELHRKLIAAARAHPPTDKVPYAFEKRIMARLERRPILDHARLLAQAWWRAALPCVAIMLLLAAWSAFVPASKVAPRDYSQEFENTVLAAADQDSSADSVW